MKITSLLYVAVTFAIHVYCKLVAPPFEAKSPASALANTTLGSTTALQGHVDTLNNTRGIPNPAQVALAKHRTFCTSSDNAKIHCARLHAYISRCVDLNPNPDPHSNPPSKQPGICTSANGFRFLKASIDLDPCGSLGDGKGEKDKVARQVCERWWREAKRCRDKRRRGPCAEHHVTYLLRCLGTFLGLGGAY
ncbi:hypothetical protein K458DRAFT_466313 [Lentithecium fluviatile CBS 122367]|uniref:Uncharacterized protein n=1 Tax=Lentithecium fluviatile CBS 122367 TaxID=1168545 RepID=A0A6G1IGH6_9PLEO|nr:hypothetical protein K458DRAFT_466313 [Lentithecium fluviatile CBS 122367]